MSIWALVEQVLFRYVVYQLLLLWPPYGHVSVAQIENDYVVIKTLILHIKQDDKVGLNLSLQVQLTRHDNQTTKSFLDFFFLIFKLMKTIFITWRH